MEVGAVAEVGEDVFFLRERRLPDPRRAFGAHVGEGRGLAIHPHRHEVAADAGGGAAAFGHAGGRVVRAAGAEVGLANRRHARLGQDFFLEAEEGKPIAELRTQLIRQTKFLQALCDRLGDHGG